MSSQQSTYHRMAYELRQGQRRNYKDLADIKLPRVKRSTKQTNPNQLYAIEIVEDKGDQVKIHYTGYSSKYDEWRDREDIVDPSSAVGSTSEPERYQPFDVHQHLAYAIKSSLTSGRDRDPAVCLEVPFDKLLFQGGMKVAGKLLRVVRGEEHYGIQQHADLVPLLGDRWFVRGLNSHLDFCAVLAETVIYYLHKKAPIIDHLCDDTIHGGYVLIFKFVRFDGVKDQLSNFNIPI